MNKFFLFFFVFFFLFCFNNAFASVVPYDSDLLNWRYDPYPLAKSGGTFGNVVYDPVSAIYRLFYHETIGNTIKQRTSSDPRSFSNDSSVLDHGPGVGDWDEESIGVPYVWYESGQTRPWRMVYRGCRTSDSRCQIGLATSLDGVTWERKDTSGNALTSPVIPLGGTGEWDATGIDFGSVIKVGSTYYIYYDTIQTAARKIGLATSTDLVNWTKDSNNPLFTGVTDYDDKDHNGSADLTAGFFCPDIVYWPRSDGSARYVLVTPHYASSAVSSSFDVYTSSSPTFSKTNRTYVGEIMDTSTDSDYLQGRLITDIDTPRIITDDITRNVSTSENTGNDVFLIAGVYPVYWNEAVFVHHKSLNGATLSGINADLPASSPSLALSLAGSDSSTKLLYLPGSSKTLRDFSGTNYHLANSGSIDSSGLKLTATNSEYAYWTASTGHTIDSLNAITGDFTLEAEVSFASDFTSSYRGIIAYSTNASSNHFYFYVRGTSGPTYTLYFSASVGGVTKSATASLGAITLNDLYKLAVTKTGGKIYFFKNGTLLNASGTAYDFTIDDSPNASLFIGSNNTGTTYFWDGYIDEIRVSNTARWTANYSTSALSYIYGSSGNIFSKVYDFGSSNNKTALLNPTKTTPTNTTVTQYVRSATSLSDESSNINDFSVIPQTGVRGQYMQFALSLATTDTSVTPTVSNIDVETDNAPTNVGISSISADSTSQLTVTAKTAVDAESALHSSPYYFNETSSNTGGSDSDDWQTSVTFVDSGLSPNTQYSYQVKAKDDSLNTSDYSTASSKYTLANIPSSLSLTADSSSLQITTSWSSNSNPSSTQYFISNVEAGTNSGWTTNTSWTSSSLSCGTDYNFLVKAKNGDEVETNSLSGSTSLTGCNKGGGGSSPEMFFPPIKPANGFKITANQGEKTTTNRSVTLNFNAGPDIKKMAISFTGDFKDASQENYTSSKEIDLCSELGGLVKKPTCSYGIYMIYTKFYTEYNVMSDVVSTKINFVAPSASSKTKETFSKNLVFGSTDSQVKALQQFLNNNGFEITDKKIGGYPGNETNYFGSLTAEALSKFQEKNKDKISGLIKEKGYLGPLTRNLINSSINITTIVKKEQNGSLNFSSLGKGMKTKDIVLLQKILATDPEIYPEGKITGYFGSLTKKAVQKFQLKYAIVNSKSDPSFGLVGPKTKTKLEEVFCSNKKTNQLLCRN